MIGVVIRGFVIIAHVLIAQYVQGFILGEEQR